jgi:hypothetical protein
MPYVSVNNQLPCVSRKSDSCISGASPSLEMQRALILAFPCWLFVGEDCLAVLVVHALVGQSKASFKMK